MTKKPSNALATVLVVISLSATASGKPVHVSTVSECIYIHLTADVVVILCQHK